MVKSKAPINQIEHLVSLHNTIILEVDKANIEIKYYLYILVKLIKPALNAFVYLLFEPQSQWYFLIIVGLTVNVTALFFVSSTSLFTSVTPQTVFYTLLLSRDHKRTECYSTFAKNSCDSSNVCPVQRSASIAAICFRSQHITSLTISSILWPVSYLLCNLSNDLVSFHYCIIVISKVLK